MVIDHVVMLVNDASTAAAEFRARDGLGSDRGMYYPRAGSRHYSIPLDPPAALEFLEIEDRTVAQQTDDGCRAVACEAAGYGLFMWAVLVDDLDAVAQRLGLQIFDYTIAHGDGTLRGWRAVDGPSHLPFFIDYPNNGDRTARLQAMYDRVGHTCSPRRFSELTISGSEAEMRDWLGPHELPLRFVDGSDGMIEARISTARDEIIVR
jgi:hypothetical protein